MENSYKRKRVVRRTAIAYGTRERELGGRPLNAGRCLWFAGSLVLGLLFVAIPALALLPEQGDSTPGHPASTLGATPQLRQETTQADNRRLEGLSRQTNGPAEQDANRDYRVGPDDLLEISVFEAQELNRTVRVSAEGEILLPLLGSVRAAGLTLSGLTSVLEERLRSSYMKDPHVGILLKEMQSHPVSVFGAVEKPGVYQIRGARTLVEVLSMAQGLAPDAGDRVIVERQGSEPVMQGASAEPGAEHSAANSPDDSNRPKDRVVEIRLKQLLDSVDPRSGALVYPGDVVKVSRADVVYVVGEVHKPGGFQLNTNDNISVLQALALAEGLTRTSAASRSRVIRTDRATGNRVELPIDIKRILAGKAPDQVLHPRDIVFIPNSTGKIALYRGVESAISIGSGILVYRAP